MKERDIEEVTNTFENMHESIDKINCAYDKLNTTIKHKHNIKSYILQNKCNIFYFILFIILLYIINFIILK
jgi:hypothetical protein